MGLQPRKLIEELVEDVVSDICSSSCEILGNCSTPCVISCPELCNATLSSLTPPPTPSISSFDHPNKTYKTQKLLIIILTVLATSFLALCFYAIYVKFFSGWCASRRRRRRSQPQINHQTTHDDFLDEDQGPVVDHHIWYINTVGLQPSIINAITVCKYKSGEGLVEGTECSVCLSEFQEDETLRLLPKCSHAFHLPCIDTWLRSHTNCPMCRAPIVINTARAPSPEVNIDNSGVGEETQMENLEENGEFRREIGGNYELRAETEDEDELATENGRQCEVLDGEVGEVQPMRRSVSLDSLSASRISMAVANVHPLESGENSDTGLAKVNKMNTGIVSKRVGGNQNLLRLLGTSSFRRSLQIGPISLKRSFSCNGKVLLSRYNRRQNSVLPL